MKQFFYSSLILFILFISFNESKSQAYCNASGDGGNNVGITSFTLDGTTQNSAANLDYTDYSGTPMGTVNQGTDISGTVTLSNSFGSSIYVSCDIYVDWDNNQSFNESAVSRGATVNSGSTETVNFTITAPTNAALTDCRIRVVTYYSAFINSCSTGFDGEVEDYSVTVQSQYCCASGDATNDLGITNVTFNGNSQASAISDYTDYSGSSLTTVSQGQTYNFSITYQNNKGFDASCIVATYVDWDHDYEFDDGVCMLQCGSYNVQTGTTTYNGSYTIPTDAALGNTRIRVVVGYGSGGGGRGGGGGIAPGPYVTGFDGEVEDYTITVALGQWTVSGYALEGETPLSGVDISYTGGSTTTDVNGYYEFTVNNNSNSSITASSATHCFSPNPAELTNITSNTSQDFSAYPKSTIYVGNEFTGDLDPIEGYVVGCNAFSDIATALAALPGGGQVHFYGDYTIPQGGGPVTWNFDFTLENGARLLLGNTDLILNGTITGFGPNAYIVTNGTGRLINTTASPVTFHVGGVSIGYSPIVIDAPAGNTYAVGFIDNSQDPEATHLLSQGYWDINHTVGADTCSLYMVYQKSNVVVRHGNPATSSSYVLHKTGGIWTNVTPSGATTLDNWSGDNNYYETSIYNVSDFSEYAPAPITGIPTLTEWAAIILGLGLLFTAVFVIRKFHF